MGMELTTTEQAQVWSAVLPETALSDGDRLRLTVIYNDAGGTMSDEGGSGTMTLFYNGLAGATGDSFIAIETAAATVTERTLAGLWTDLVAYWKLDEPSGVRDDYVGSSHLTDNNTVTQATGKVGNAGQFTRANSEWLSRADNAALSMGDIGFTICGWMYFDSVTAGQQRILVSKHRTPLDSDDDYAYTIEVNGSGYFSFAVGNGAGGFSGWNQATAFGQATTGQWYFVVCWHDPTANTVNLQINNGTVFSWSYSGGSYDDVGAFQIGRHDNANSLMNGRIDGVGIWKRVLTSDERSELYNGGNGWNESLTVPELAKNSLAMVV
jgi:hypothetical protein